VKLPDSTLTSIVAFLNGIGLPVEYTEISEPTFLPGIHACRGALLADPAKLTWPGDLLHEAGHLALLTPAERLDLTGNLGDDGGNEVGAIAWSYAAALHISLDPAVVFHPGGYHEGSGTLLEAFATGRYIGLPILQWRGLCLDAANARQSGLLPYPHMLRWLRE